MVLGTAPSRRLSLKVEVRLAKAALLYADAVVLFSPTAAALLGTAEWADQPASAVVAFLREVAPAFQGSRLIEACDFYDVLRRKRRRTRAELQQLAHGEAILREGARELGAKGRELLSESTGGGELEVARAAGVLHVDPLISGSEGMEQAFLNKLDDLMTRSSAYPLFDEQVRELIDERVTRGLVAPEAGAIRRGKQAGSAASSIQRMPALPGASMSDILKVRGSLVEPLGRFRAGVIKLSRMVEATPLDRDFDAEVRDIYVSEVDPALQEIAEAFLLRGYAREFIDASFHDIHALFAGAAGLGIEVAGSDHFSAIAAAASGVGAAGGVTAAHAANRVRHNRHAARANQMYFLYEANRRLRGR